MGCIYMICIDALGFLLSISTVFHSAGPKIHRNINIYMYVILAYRTQAGTFVDINLFDLCGAMIWNFYDSDWIIL